MNLSDAASVKIGTTNAIEVRLGSITIWSAVSEESEAADFLTYDSSSVGTIVNPAVRSRLLSNPRNGESAYNDSSLDSSRGWYPVNNTANDINSSNTTEWLQIDLGEDQSVTGIVTQGVFSAPTMVMTKYRVEYCDEASIQFSVSGMASNTSSDTYFNSSNVGHYEASGTYNGKVQYAASGEPDSKIRYRSSDDKWEFVYDGDEYYIAGKTGYSNPWAVRSLSHRSNVSGWNPFGNGSAESLPILSVDQNTFTDVNSGVEFIRDHLLSEGGNNKTFEAFPAPVTARYVTIFPTGARNSNIGIMMRAGVVIDSAEVALTSEFIGSSTVDWGDGITDDLVNNTTISHVFDPTYFQPVYNATIADDVRYVDEGSSVTINVTATNTPDGTKLYYRATDSRRRDDLSDADFSGEFTITNNQGSFTVTLLADGITEPSTEYLRYNILTGSTAGTVVAQSDAIVINDTSQTPYVLTYQGGGNSTSGRFIDEGDALTVNVASTVDAPGTTLYWTILHQHQGLNADTEDFEAVSGDFTIGANGTGSFTITPIADATTEGDESFRIEIRTGSTSGPVVATMDEVHPFRINDTSQDGDTSAPTYDVTPPRTNFGNYITNVDEGSALTMTVATTNVPDGTTLYWTIGDNASDFGTTSGDFTINSQGYNGEGTFTVTPTADSATEGAETFTVQIRTGGINGTIVDTSTTLTINDTSQGAFTPDYTLSVSFGGTGYYALSGSDANGTVSGNNPALTFSVGDKVRFNNSVSGAHPLYITTSSGSVYNNLASGVSGAGSAQVDWTIASAGTYYYQCSVHSNMYGVITVT